jgi:hypothetical protein
LRLHLIRVDRSGAHLVDDRMFVIYCMKDFERGWTVDILYLNSQNQLFHGPEVKSIVRTDLGREIIRHLDHRRNLRHNNLDHNNQSAHPSNRKHDPQVVIVPQTLPVVLVVV